MSTASEHERKHDRLAIAEAYADYLDSAPNGLESDLFDDTFVSINAPLALIQCSIKCQVDLLERLTSDGLLITPTDEAARLIAAAPDLLEAAKTMVEYYDAFLRHRAARPGETEMYADPLRAAIAKAEPTP